MRAVRYHEHGGSDVLRVEDADDPKLGPDGVLLDVRAASVNPVDWKVAAGGLDTMLDTFFPVVPGWDVSGVVTAVGPAVQHLSPGDEVYGYVRKDAVHGGTYAEKVAAPVRTVAPKPSTLDFAEAAAVPLAGLTAYQAVVHRLSVGEGRTVLIHAASGGVGSFAVQIAVAHGARVIGTASEDNHDYLRRLGAEPVAYGDGLEARVRELAPDGVDAVVDLVGGDALQQSPGLLAAGADGQLVSVIDPAVADVGGNYLFVSPDAADLAALARMADAGQLRVEVAARYPLAEAGRAWEASMSGHTRGKIVLTVD